MDASAHLNYLGLKPCDLNGPFLRRIPWREGRSPAGGGSLTAPAAGGWRTWSGFWRWDGVSREFVRWPRAWSGTPFVPVVDGGAGFRRSGSPESKTAAVTVSLFAGKDDSAEIIRGLFGHRGLWECGLPSTASCGQAVFGKCWHELVREAPSRLANTFVSP